MMTYFKYFDEFCNIKKKIFFLKADVPMKIIKFNQQNKNIMVKKNDIKWLCRKILGWEPIFISKLGIEGTFHTVYEVKFPERRNLIIRTNIIDHSYSGPDFYFDKYITKKLQSIGLPAIAIYYIDITRKLCRFDYQIMKKAAGVPLSTIEDQKEFEKSIEMLGKFVAKYHQIAIPKYGPLDIIKLIKDNVYCGLHNSWKEYLLLNLKQHIKVCIAAKAISSQEAQKIYKKFEYIEYFDVKNGSLLHGDLGNQNVFFNKGQISSLVDWEDCIIGDPVYDIAYWGSFGRNDKPEILKVFLRGYQNKGSLPKDFLIKYWIYYLRIAIAKTVHRYKFKYHILGENRIKKALLKLDELGI